MLSIPASFKQLKNYIDNQEYKDWDPYDGLNSKVFQATPLKHWDLARLAWIQLFKRNPVNLRILFLVPKDYNPKGVALILSGYCNLYQTQKAGNDLSLELAELKSRIQSLADLLISLQSKGDYSGACWGYNFDWQARRLFLFPAYTPTVVATTFAASSLFPAYEITKKQNYLDVALSSADFIINDLNRTPKKRGFLFSYSPLNGNNTVYNASLLGSKLLSYCYHYSGKEEYKQLARESIVACVAAQSEYGSWVYGELPTQNWIDSFHTGYNLEAIHFYQKFTKDYSFAKNLEKGFKYYINTFFMVDGTPKYYSNKTYPIDIHCPAQLFVTMFHLAAFINYQDMAEKVMNWTINNMQDKKGYFYYQLKKGMSSKISYMRWSNAFMFYAMSYYLRFINN